MKNLYKSILTQQHFDAIIIGSGLGGLTTAALFAKKGKKVLILEKHYEAGGFTHTFNRKDLSWDVGVHYVGQVNNPDALMTKAFQYATEGKLQWASMGEIYDKAIIDGDEYNFVCGEENQIQEHLKHFPDEEKALRSYFAQVKNMGAATSMFFGEKSMPYWLSNFLGILLRKKFYSYSDQTTFDALSKLTTNQKLIAVLCAQCGNYGLPPKQSSFAMQAMITGHYLDGGNYPVGGASEIHKTLLSTIEKYGGVLALKADVQEIVITKNKANGVRLKNGDILKAPIVVSNVGARNTFKKLVHDQSSIKSIQHELEHIKASVAHICLYIGLDCSDEELNLPKYNYWLYNTYDFDSSYAAFLKDSTLDIPLAYISFPSAKDPAWNDTHPHKATIQVICAASYDWVKQWEDTKWQKRGEDYLDFKSYFEQKLTEKVLEVVPQIKGHIILSEISTPLSTKHFSSYQEGEIYGLEHTPRRFRLNSLRVHTPIKGLYLTGQDIISVGIGGALFSGVLAASSILKTNFLSAIETWCKKEKGSHK